MKMKNMATAQELSNIDVLNSAVLSNNIELLDNCPEEDVCSNKSSQEVEPLLDRNKAKINSPLLIKNTFKFFVDGILIFISSMLDLWVNFLIYNVILLFGLRRFLLRGTEMLVTANLYVIELFILIQVITISIVYVLTRTTVKRETENRNVYNSRGFLKLSVIHNHFWNNKYIVFSNPICSVTKFAGIKPLSKFLDIPAEDTSEQMGGIQSLSYEYSMDHSENHDATVTCQVKIENSTEDNCSISSMTDNMNDRKKPHHFPFNYKKLKKKSESTQDQMDAFETFITDKLNEIPIPGSRMSIKSNIFK